jgi:hypothetical protein
MEKLGAIAKLSYIKQDIFLIKVHNDRSLLIIKHSNPLSAWAHLSGKHGWKTCITASHQFLKCLETVNAYAGSKILLTRGKNRSLFYQPNDVRAAIVVPTLSGEVRGASKAFEDTS